MNEFLDEPLATSMPSEGGPMLSFLALGFLIGLRHALEPDHVAAVVSLSTRGGTLREQAQRGLLWGAGHALTLLLLAGGCVWFGVAIPASTSRFLEGSVGVMLVALGVSVFLRLRHGGVQLQAAEHAHAPRSSRGPLGNLGVGAVHGLAGSSALVLLVGGAAGSPALGLAYIALFGLGAIAGMMILAGLLTIPFGAPEAVLEGQRALWYRLACRGAGAVSIVLGVHLIWLMTS